jgi:hypothetical protein
MEFYVASSNVPFSIALGIVLLMGAFEVLSLLLGGSSSLLGMEGPDGVDGLQPDSEVSSEVSGFGQLLAWFHFGALPLTILLMLFLLTFSVSGLALQNLLQSRFGILLPAAIAIWPAGIIALFATRLGGGLLKPLLPREETQSVSQDSFIGCAAYINIGTARRGQPAEARLLDKFGRTHYVMVEPEHDEEFKAGSAVLILKRHEHVYRVIDNTGAEV